ncbi:MAG: hypothetical protein H6581_26110 [Bacteroidia bacterium]|nr:hypothetical protein [Bacteroidia bacterium]
MNLLQAVYCNQYYELNPKGKGPAARQNGNMLVTVALVFNFFTLMVLLAVLVPGFAHFWDHLFRDLFGDLGGRTIGRIIAAVPLALCYPLVRFTLGTQEKFDQMIQTYEGLDPEEQKRISNRGMIYFFVSLGVVVIPVIILVLR